MTEKCNLLILSSRFGNGHISAANAIKECLLSVNKDYKVNIIDFCEVLIPEKSNLFYQIYDSIIKKVPTIYNYCMRCELSNKIYKKLRLKSEDKNLQNFDYIINKYNPDIILSVFPVATEIASAYKDIYKKQIPLYTCITDMVDSDEWLHPNNNLYFVPNKCIAEKIFKKGVPEEEIVASGIPIRKEFFKKYDKSELKEVLGFKNDDIIILIMGGGLGRLPENLIFYKWINKKGNVKTIIITAQNKILYKKLKKLDLINCRIYEYVDEIYKFMSIADFIVSKGGGVTLFESIVSLLPMIIYKPELSQELENSKFILRHELGFVAKNLSDLVKFINIMLYENLTDKFIDNMKCLGKDVCMDNIIEKILTQD